jgi:5-formyltetrahydrofolate cyclo-ligase
LALNKGQKDLMNMEPTKTALRAFYLKKRKELSKETHEQQSFAVANQCLQLPIWDYRYFHLFLPIESKAEMDTSLVLTLLQGRDKEVVLPKLEGPRDLKHILLTDSTRIVNNSWQIPEPSEGIFFDPLLLDVVFVPLLICDLKGHRVGYGKGYYDRFLSQCKPEVLKIGLSFFNPIPAIADSYSGDIPLDYCVCPDKIYRF